MNVDWSNSYIQYTYINLVKLRSLWWWSGYVAMKFVAGLNYLASCHHHHMTLTIIIFDLFSNIIVVTIYAQYQSRLTLLTFKTLSIYVSYQNQIAFPFPNSNYPKKWIFKIKYFPFLRSINVLATSVYINFMYLYI